MVMFRSMCWNISMGRKRYWFYKVSIWINLDSGSLWSPLKWLFTIFLILSCLGGIALLYKFYILRNRRNVSFE